MAQLADSAQTMLEKAYEAEDGHYEQTLFDGRVVCATDYNETLLIKDFRKDTVVWTEDHVTFDQLCSIINVDNEARIDAGMAF